MAFLCRSTSAFKIKVFKCSSDYMLPQLVMELPAWWGRDGGVRVAVFPPVCSPTLIRSKREATS